MANESGEQVEGERRWPGKTAPGLAGLYGRLRIAVAGQPVATLVVEGMYVALVPDTSGPADAATRSFPSLVIAGIIHSSPTYVQRHPA